MPQVFLSYSRKDLEFVEKLAGDLKKSGFEVWYDLSGLAGGAHWRREIEAAIKNSQYIVVVLSPDSVESEWVEREFLFASDRARPIIPVMYRTCELPMNYLNLNYIDFRGNKYRENFDELLEALNVESAAGTLPPSGSGKPSFPLKTGLIIAVAAALLGILWFVIDRKPADDVQPVTATAPPSEISPTTEIAPASSVPVDVPPDTITPAPADISTPTLTPFPAEISDADPSGNPISMRLVPEGEFTMGSNSGDPEEKPAHTVFLDAFYMDTYEVTNALYKACVSAGICEPPQKNSSYGETDYYGNPDFDNYPVVQVTWFQSQAYCEWRGAYLPSEAQWEKAARGTDGRPYPWGEGISCNLAGYEGCSRDVEHVGDHPNGISPFGIHDMAGNAWEWVADWYSEKYYRDSPASNPLGPVDGTHRVMRGGTWDSPAENLQTFNRLKFRPAYFTEGIGFRCAREATP